jgi:hypothetical protein
MYNLLHSPVTSSLLGPNILLSTLFSNVLSKVSLVILGSSKETSAEYAVTLGKGKAFPAHTIKTYRGVEVQLHSFLTSALAEGSD